jgi:hypothetical protein
MGLQAFGQQLLISQGRSIPGKTPPGLGPFYPGTQDGFFPDVFTAL